jgi:DNA-binding NarL/FixJ family response regulator
LNSKKKPYCSLSVTSIGSLAASYRNQIRIRVSNMCRILIVDDNEPVRRSIQTLLGSRKGWLVCGEAADGLQAVEEAKSLRPDLIIMDVSMPNMNGLDAAKIILREVCASRILIISQNEPAIVRRQALEVSAHGFIEKSNIQRDLIAAVECILSGDGQSNAEKAS